MAGTSTKNLAEGNPVHPTVTQAPVANTTAGVYTFASPMAEVYIENRTGQTMYVKLGGSVADPAATFDWTFQVGTGEYRSFDIRTKRLSVWFPTSSTLQIAEPAGGAGSGTQTYVICGWPEVRTTDPYA